MVCGDTEMEWTMEPVLAQLQPRLPDETYRLLAALVATLSDGRNLPALASLAAWRDAPADAFL